jgi:hypothetical protein
MLRSGDTLVVRWVDRLGRNYVDVTDTIRKFMRRGVVVKTVINGLVFDGATKDPPAIGPSRGHEGSSASRDRTREGDQ